MFHPDNSGSSGPLWLGDWKYQIGSSNTCKLKDMRKVFEKNFLSDNTIVQETNGVIVFNM
jgi:hypothetical protein